MLTNKKSTKNLKNSNELNNGYEHEFHLELVAIQSY